MNKRGVSNLEFILSFVLFVGLAGAAIYFINPTKDTGALASSADYVVNEIITNASVEIESYSIKITTTDSIVAVTIPEVDSNKNARVEDYNGDILPSRRSGDDVIFERQNNDFVIVKFSEDYAKGEFDGTATPSDQKYTIASFTSSRLISERKLLALKAQYETDYNSLKLQRSIPEGINFLFRLEMSGGQILETSKKIPVNAEVFSETKIREILKNNGASEFGYLNIKIW